MAIYHVSINQQDFEVDSTSTSEAIKLALDEFAAQATDNPDNCDVDTSTQGIHVIGEFVGDVVSST